MIALVGLFATFLILEGSAFSPIDGVAHPMVWLALPIATPVAGVALALALQRRNVAAHRRRTLLGSFHLVAYLATYAATIYPAGGARFVFVRLGWLGQPLVSHVLLLLPAVLLALWATVWFHWAERRFLGPRGREAERFSSWFARRARLVAVPTGIITVAILTTEGLGCFPEPAAFLETHSSATILVVLLLMAGVVVAFPALALLAWPSERLSDGTLRRSLEEMSASAGVKLRDVRIWKRTESVVNACVVGHFGPGRRVLFTQGARAYLSDVDLRAVFAHEVSHITSGHLWCYSALLVAYILALSPLEQSLEASPPWVTGVAIVTFTAAVWWLLFGFLSRRLEAEADLRGAELMPPGAYLAAFDRVRGLLGASAGHDGWRHFSVERRQAILSAALAHRDVRRALLDTCRRGKLACYATLLVAVAGFAWSAERELTRPAAEVALARGSYLVARADDLRWVLEMRRSGPVPEVSWLSRGSGRIERDYAETLAMLGDTLEPLESGSSPPGTREDSASLHAAYEDHRSWWSRRSRD